MVNDASRYRPGSQTRGEDTRRRILQTAIELFATEGYEGTSTRLLAERAGVNLPAIQYYFGSKEGLYRAAVARISEEIDAQMGPARERAMSALEKPSLGRRELCGLLCDLLDAFVTLVLSGFDASQGGRKQFISRAEIEGQPALDLLHDNMMRLVLRPCAAVLARVTGRPAEDEETVLRAIALLGQVTIFCNKPTRRALNWTEFNPERVARIQSVVRRHTQALLAHEAGEGA
jgi:TetR/AcrR family transcriptional regulator, regulator of cefoperazone and chloramphenicol sensitivity